MVLIHGVEFSISVKVEVNKSTELFNYSLSIILNFSGETGVRISLLSNFIS
jgi:hypothetical protein